VLSPWRSEFYWLVWLGLVGFFAGKLTGLYGIAFALCAMGYLARHLFQLNRLLLWLRSGGKIPAGGGIWDEIYYLIYRIRRRNKRRKKRLIVMLERFRTATAALPDATVVLGARDEIEWFNEAAGRLLGLRKSDVGQQIVNLVRFPKFIEYLGESNYSGALTVPSPVKSGVYLEIRVVPYGDDLRLLVAQDVSHIRFMERVRRDFVANVSHELRTPLTVLRGYMETLEDVGEEIPERFQKVFRRMEEQTGRMQALIDDLLMLTRLESDAGRQHQWVDVPALLRQLNDEARILDEEHAPIELLLDSEAGVVGSESELRSALSNLLVNAIKYTPPSGQIRLRWYETEGGVRLDVEDTGPGVAPEHLPRLTERFYRVEVGDVRNKGGTGLGLAIVKHVLARHDGELQIRSTLGRGSCFSCSFPGSRLLWERPTG
jgi:two-component system, OmpR family, phosphate regulon sensor histidine kinase PhoR